MKILFLDFDNVLHTFGDIWMRMGHSCMEFTPKATAFKWVPDLMEILRDFPDVHVVIHSTWRVSKDVDEIKLILFQFGHPDLADRILATTGPFGGRYSSIQKFIEEFGIAEYVIVDDDRDELPDDGTVVFVPPARGISDSDAKKELRAALERMR